MRTAGSGSELWRVRVDIFVSSGSSGLVSAAKDALSKLLTGPVDQFDVGADQGLGVTSKPIVGLLFWVRADNVGQAAGTAVDFAFQAFNRLDRGTDLYDVTVIPERSVILTQDSTYPMMPD